MNSIKKAGIVLGAVTGGVLGGTVTLIGKMTKVDFIEELGEGIVDSALLTGQLVGEAVSGTADIVSGGITKDGEKMAEGTSDLKHAAVKTVGNAVHNIKMLGTSGSEIATGLAAGDGQKAMEGLKNLGKMAAIGLITVGAIKVKKKEPVETSHIIPDANTEKITELTK